MDERLAYELPDSFPNEAAAPLLCSGIVPPALAALDRGGALADLAQGRVRGAAVLRPGAR